MTIEDQPAVPPAADMTVIDGVDSTTARDFAEVDIDTVGQLRDADLEKITSVEGISYNSAVQMRLGATRLVHNHLAQCLLHKHDEAVLPRLAEPAGIDPSASLITIADTFVQRYARSGRKYLPVW